MSQDQNSQLSTKDYYQILEEQTRESIIEKNIYTHYLHFNQNAIIRASVLSQEMVKDITQNGIDDIDKLYEREFKMLELSHKLQKTSIENLADRLQHSRELLKDEQNKT